jgi:dTDP-4-amino-4,6-dideoxygalactose transaminase
MINYGKQNINQDDIDSVIEVLKSDFLTQGPKVPQFEEDLKKYCQVKYSKVVSNATSALHLAYLAVGLQKGDIVWTSPNTFVSTANAALYCGATVDFVDIDPNTYNISIDCLKEKLVQAKKTTNFQNSLCLFILQVKVAIWKQYGNLSKEYKFKVVEDASHALGGKYKGEKIGNCKYSDMAVFSFHPVKMITTGEGGAVTTNSKSLDEKVSLLRTHGITKDPSQFDSKSHGDWYYEQQVFGL